MQVPMFVERGNIDEKIVIPNIGKELNRREYVSRKVVNGFEDQTFTSDDCPDSFRGIFIGEEEDPGNEKMHPSYLAPVTTKPWIPFGNQGWRAVSEEFELDSIARKLLAQNNIANIRSATESDLKDVDIPDGKFWLSRPTHNIIHNKGIRFDIKYVDNGEVKRFKAYNAYYLNQSAYQSLGNIGAGILAVVTLDTVIVDEDPTERFRGLWG